MNESDKRTIFAILGHSGFLVVGTVFVVRCTRELSLAPLLPITNKSADKLEPTPFDSWQWVKDKTNPERPVRINELGNCGRCQKDIDKCNKMIQ